MSQTSTKHIFEIRRDHIRFPDKWFLDEPLTATGEEIDAREFTEGVPYRGSLPAVVPIFKPGREIAFHLAAFDMPVVSTAVAEAVLRIAPNDVQCFPVEVPDSKRSYLILNVVCALDCLDEGRSEVTRWQQEDNRPDRLGQIHVISTIRIDPVRTQNHHIFRIKNWPLALLVSDTIKDALDAIPDLGIVFEPAD